MPFLALSLEIAECFYSVFAKALALSYGNQWFNVQSNVGAWLLPCSEYYTFSLLSRKDVCSFMHLFPWKESK